MIRGSSVGLQGSESQFSADQVPGCDDQSDQSHQVNDEKCKFLKELAEMRDQLRRLPEELPEFGNVFRSNHSSPSVDGSYHRPTEKNGRVE